MQLEETISDATETARPSRCAAADFRDPSLGPSGKGQVLRQDGQFYEE
jgi:hypothetical protein